MVKETKITTNLTFANEEEGQKESLQIMNKFLKELKIEEKWEKYDDIRVIGQPDRLLYYTVVGFVLFAIYCFGASIVLFKYQTIVLQIGAMVVTVVIKACLPKAEYTVQFPSKKSYTISLKEKERFQIGSEMYDFVRHMDSRIRAQKMDSLKKKKDK